MAHSARPQAHGVAFGSEGMSFSPIKNLTSIRTLIYNFGCSVAPLRKVSELSPKRLSEYFPKRVSDFAEIRNILEKEMNEQKTAERAACRRRRIRTSAERQKSKHQRP